LPFFVLKGFLFYRKEEFKMKNKSILKLVVLALLSAIGVLLMSIFQIDYIPPLNFLKIEFSDFVVIFTFLLFGFKEAAIVAVVKTLCDLLIRGPQAGGSIPLVAHVTALIASLSYVLCLWLANKIIKGNKFGHKLAKYAIVILLVSTIMTFANYTILTPWFLGEPVFFGIGLSEGNMNAIYSFGGVDNFFLAIVAMYLPFNLLKASCIAFISITIGDTILFIYRKKLRLEENTQKPIENEKSTHDILEHNDMSIDDMFK
jgi:riboflavin transporter FmnP